MTGLVSLERSDGIAVLTLNRPDKRNALNLALWGELEAHLAAIEQADLALQPGLAHEVYYSAGTGPDMAERVGGFGKT